jgi:leucyl aminopeptidase
MLAKFADPKSHAIPLHLVSEDQLDNWLGGQPASVSSWIVANSFTGALGQALVIPTADGSVQMAVAGYGTETSRKRGRFHLAGAAAKLPKGAYQLETDLPQETLANETLGWLLSAYRFDRYAKTAPMQAELIAPDGVNTDLLIALASGEMLTRDLINTPASDMGPPDLEKAAHDLAKAHGADISVVTPLVAPPTARRV